MYRIDGKEYAHLWDVPGIVEGSEIEFEIADTSIWFRTWVAECPNHEDLFHVIYDIRDHAGGRDVFLHEDVTDRGADMGDDHFSLGAALEAAKALADGFPQPDQDRPDYNSDIFVEEIYKHYNLKNMDIGEFLAQALGEMGGMVSMPEDLSGYIQ